MAEGIGRRAMGRILAAFFFAWLIALLALTYWPHMPDITTEEDGFRTDYLGHFGFYAVLLLIFLLWQQFRGRKITLNYIIQVALIGLALGTVTELTQQFIPDRSLNPFDLMFNCLGIVAGAVAYRVVSRIS